MGLGRKCKTGKLVIRGGKHVRVPTFLGQKARFTQIKKVDTVKPEKKAGLLYYLKRIMGRVNYA